MNKAIKATHYIMANTAGITSLVPASRIFPVRAQQGAAYPYITHQLLTNRPDSDKDGPSNFDFAQVMVSIYSESITDAQTIAEAIRTGLDRKTPGTFDGVAVAQIDYEGEAHLPEDDAGNDQVYLIQMEFTVNYHR
jgi:hypothetical protein